MYFEIVEPSQDVIVFAFSNEIDPWGFLLPSAGGTYLVPLAEVIAGAVAALFFRRWLHGVFMAAIAAPLFIVAFWFPIPVWNLPLWQLAALICVHFAVVLSSYAIAFWVKRQFAR